MISTGDETKGLGETPTVEEEVPNEDTYNTSVKNTAPDGGWGWVVLFAFFLLNLISEGVSSSLTLVFVELLDYFKGTKADTSWILSLNYSVCFLSGPIVATLTDQFGCRAVSLVGTLIVAAGMIISIFTPNLYFLYFSLGFLPGIGNGLMYIPGFVCLSVYFDKRRALATGLCVCGCGLGIFLFSPLTALLIEIYTWRGAMLVQAGLLLNCLACSLVFKPLSHDKKTYRQEGKALLNSNEAKTEISDSAQDSVVIKYNVETDIETDIKYHETENDNIRYSADEDGDTKQTFFNNIYSDMLVAIYNSFRESVSPRQFRNKAFALFAVSSFLTDFGFYQPYVYLAAKSHDQGVGEIETAWIISTIGITSTVGRVVFGFFSDRKWVNRLYLYNSALVLNGIATLLGPVFSSFSSLLIYAMIFGMCTGTNAMLTSVLLCDIVGTKNLPQALGMVSFFSGIGVLVGPPLGGWLYDMSGSYNGLFLASGISLSFAGVMLCMIPCIDKAWNKR